MHISRCFSYSFWSHFHIINPYKNIKQNIHPQTSTPIFKELLHSMLPMIKKHIRLFAGIINDSFSFIDTRFQKNVKQGITETIKYILKGTTVKYQHYIAASCTYQTTINKNHIKKKKAYLITTTFQNFFLKKSGEWTISRKRTRQREQED